MVNKKRKTQPSLQELLDRPVCYYCDKDFEDLSFLVDHQKAKHFKCERCGRRLTTIGGLSVHMSQVHKEKLEGVANAMPGRDKPDIEIFGMEGYPKAMLEANRKVITDGYFKREAEHRARTGNPPTGTQSAGANPQKTESKEEMKKRLAEFKARKAAEKAAEGNGSSGANTPNMKKEASEPAAMQEATPPMHPHTPNMPDQSNAGWGQPHGYGMPSYPPASAPYEQMMPNMAAPPMYPNPAMPVPYQNTPPPHMQARGPTPNRPGLGFQSKPPTGMSGSPTLPQPPHHISPPQQHPPPAAATRQNSLPSAPSLPQRPAFDSPNISKEDMAKMHIGSGPPSQQSPYGNGQPPPGAYGPPPGAYVGQFPPNGAPQPQWGMAHSPNAMPQAQWQPPKQANSRQPPIGDQVDDLIRSVTGEGPPMQPQHQFQQHSQQMQPPQNSDKPGPRPQDLPEPMPIEEDAAKVAAQTTHQPDQTARPSTPLTKPGKKAKKAGAEKAKLTWSDNHTSPEEARAKKFKLKAGVVDQPTETVIVQPGDDDSRRVTGPVEDIVEKVEG